MEAVGGNYFRFSMALFSYLLVAAIPLKRVIKHSAGVSGVVSERFILAIFVHMQARASVCRPESLSLEWFRVASNPAAEFVISIFRSPKRLMAYSACGFGASRNRSMLEKKFCVNLTLCVC